MNGMPQFLLIGAARAGTTAIYSYLRQCPEIFMPRVKEPNFFAFEGQTLACRGPGADYINNSITRLADYRDLFATSPPGAVLGEASPLYLFADQAAARIRHHAPDARLVVVLRNPVEQAFSHFMYATKQRIEPLTDFVAALNAEDQRIADGWQPLFGYSRFPRYSEQLARYLALFPREQILIRLYEEFERDPATLMQDILAPYRRHIGLSPGHGGETQRRWGAQEPDISGFPDEIQPRHPRHRSGGAPGNPAAHPRPAGRFQPETRRNNTARSPRYSAGQARRSDQGAGTDDRSRFVQLAHLILLRALLIGRNIPQDRKSVV